MNSAINDINLKLGTEINSLKTKVTTNESNITDVSSTVKTCKNRINFLENRDFSLGGFYGKDIDYLAGMSDSLNANGVGNTAFINQDLNPLKGNIENGMKYDQYCYKISIFRGRKTSEDIYTIWRKNGNTFNNGYLRVTPGLILIDEIFFIRVHRYSEENETLEMLYQRGAVNLKTFLSHYNIDLTIGRDPNSPKGNTGYIFTNNSKYNFAIMEYFKLWS